MDFGSILSAAQKNTKTSSSERSKFYSTKFEPPKKETKEKKLSDGIKKFLEQRNHDEQKEKERKRKEYEELMALRSERDKNKIRKHLKVTKSANKSVLDDAVNSMDTAVTMQGPEQPDEDDYGYTSNEASALYKSLMDKYKSMPEDKKFAKSSLNGSKNADLMSTKDRVRAAIQREKEDEKLGRKRSTTTNVDLASSASSEQKSRSRKNLYDPRAEREAEERRKKELEDEKRKKLKNKRPPPPVLDFQKLLKLAEEKQHEPIKVEVPQKQKEPERLLTGKEKREIEMKKKELEERERRRMGLPPSKPPSNGEQKKPEVAQTMNGRIPKLNGSNASSSKPSLASTSSASTLDNRKPSTSSAREPIRPVTNASSHNKTPSKPQAQSSGSKATFAKPNTPQPNGKRPLDLKSRSQVYDANRNVPKPSAASKPAAKPTDMKNVKPREFPPRDVVKAREFPPRDVIKSREFPPRDLVKTREFPPRDMQRGHAPMKHKQAAGSKRRVIDDSDEDEDEDEYDSMDDFIDDDEGFDYSSEIRNIFGYDKSRYRDEDDDIDNMESSFAQQQREEYISKKIGIQEDLDDIRLEAEEKKRKAAKRRRL